MNKIIALPPATGFFTAQADSNNFISYAVPRNRDQSDPFYVIPELETDECIYWTGSDTKGNNTQYFTFKDHLDFCGVKI